MFKGSFLAGLGIGLVTTFVSAVVIKNTEEKKRERSNKNKFSEGVLAGENRAKQKFSKILLSFKQRDHLMLIAFKFVLFNLREHGKIDIIRMNKLYNHFQNIHLNPTIPQFLKDEFKSIEGSELTLNDIQKELDQFKVGKPQKHIDKSIKYINTLIEEILN
jgi:hypothetical protein